MRLTGLRVKHVNSVGGDWHPNDGVRLTVYSIHLNRHTELMQKLGPVVEVVADAIYLIASGAVALLLRTGRRTFDLVALQVALTALKLTCAIAVTP